MSGCDDEIVDKIFNDCLSCMKIIFEKSEKCYEFFQPFYKNFKYNMESDDSSPIKRLRLFMFVKYLSAICLFMISKISANASEINVLLPRLCECVIELEKTKSLVVKEENLKKISQLALKSHKINVESTKSRPNLSKLIPKIRQKDENSENSDFGSNMNDDEPKKDIYIPPKDKFVPYPFDRKNNANDTMKRKGKSSYKQDVISHTLASESNEPLEIKNNTERLNQNSLKKCKAPIDSQLNIMEEELDMEHLADGFPLHKASKKQTLKRKNSRVSFRKSQKKAKH